MVSACTYMYHMCTYYPLKSKAGKAGISFLGAGAMVILSHHMGAQNQTWTLHKTNKCS